MTGQEARDDEREALASCCKHCKPEGFVGDCPDESDGHSSPCRFGCHAETRDDTGRVLCPQPCVHLSAEDSREGKECPEHPCTCSEREARERKTLTLAGLDYWAQNAVNPYTCRCGWSATGADASTKAQHHRMRAALEAALRVPVGEGEQ